MLENAIFIEEVSAEKDNAQCDSYRHYVCGLRLGAEDYTARITIGVKGGKYFYDHALTNIEKATSLRLPKALYRTEDKPYRLMPRAKIQGLFRFSKRMRQ